MQLHYKTFGEGEPLIILHGLFGSLTNWQSISKKLAQHFQIFTVDLRNHGHSPHSNQISYELMSEDLMQFMTDHQLAPANLMGHSMGGKTAMQFTLQYPYKVNKLIVVDIAPKVYPNHHQPIFEALMSLDLESLQSKKEADQFLEHKLPNQSERQFLLQNLTRDQAGNYSWRMNLNGLYKHYPELLKDINVSKFSDVPTLFVKGALSNYITADDWPHIIQLFPQARLETIGQAGHWVHAEQPDLFLNIILRFYKSNRAGSHS